MEEDLLLKQYAAIVSDVRFMKVFAEHRPERIACRAPEGTEDRLDVLMARGLGESRSSVVHVALQLGLYALEDAFGVTPEEEEEVPEKGALVLEGLIEQPKGDMGMQEYEDVSLKGDVGVRDDF